MKKLVVIAIMAAFVLGFGVSYVIFTYEPSGEDYSDDAALNNELIENINFESAGYSIIDGEEYLLGVATFDGNLDMYYRIFPELDVTDLPVVVSLVNEDNSETYMSYDMTWNLDDELIVKLPIDRSQITDQKTLDFFNDQIDNVKNHLSSRILYSFDVSGEPTDSGSFGYCGLGNLMLLD